MEKDSKPATEDLKIDMFEDDDEFEEFDIDQGYTIYLISLLILLFQKIVQFLFFLIFNKKVYFWSKSRVFI